MYAPKDKQATAGFQGFIASHSTETAELSLVGWATISHLEATAEDPCIDNVMELISDDDITFARASAATTTECPLVIVMARSGNKFACFRPPDASGTDIIMVQVLCLSVDLSV